MTIIVRNLGLQEYLISWQAMKKFTDQRTPQTPDEFWVLEHPPVFTLGQNGKAEHVLNACDVPVVHSDRGGQVTYHGPGQLVLYTLVDLKRKQLNIRQMVTQLENAMIQLLADWNIVAYADCKAPGVYIAQQKIGSVGLRVRRGCTYHGLAMNIAMDLAPFSQINPCGYPQLKMTQLSSFCPDITLKGVGQKLIHYLTLGLGYTKLTCL